MFVMLTLLVSTATIRAIPVFEVKVEGGIYSSVIDKSTGNIAWTNHSNQTASNFMLDVRSRKVTRLGNGSFERPRIDCGKGLLTLLTKEKDLPQYETYSFRTGEKVGIFPGHIHRRIGGVIETHDGYYDLNGRILRRKPSIDYRKPNPEDTGTLIWDGKRRLAIVSRYDRRSDAKDVVELTFDWRKGKRAWLSDYAFGFENIIGNPDEGEFAVTESSNRSVHTTGLYARDLTRIPAQKMELLAKDVGPHGILAQEIQTGEYSQASIGGICLDARSGKVKWRSKFVGEWYGKDVFLWDSILDGRTGKLKARIDYGKGERQILGFAGSHVFVLVGDSRLVVYRLPK